MGKQSVSIKGTSVSNGNAVGNHVEQTLYMEDNLSLCGDKCTNGC